MHWRRYSRRVTRQQSVMVDPDEVVAEPQNLENTLFDTENTIRKAASSGEWVKSSSKCAVADSITGLAAQSLPWLIQENIVAKRHITEMIDFSTSRLKSRTYVIAVSSCWNSRSSMGVINAELQASSLQLCTQKGRTVGRVIVEIASTSTYESIQRYLFLGTDSRLLSKGVVAINIANLQLSIYMHPLCSRRNSQRKKHKTENRR